MPLWHHAGQRSDLHRAEALHVLADDQELPSRGADAAAARRTAPGSRRYAGEVISEEELQAADNRLLAIVDTAWEEARRRGWGRSR